MTKELTAIAALLFASASAHATLLDGQTVEYSHLFPYIGTVHYGPIDAVVGSGAEFNYFGYYSVDVSDTNITVQFLTSSYFDGTAFNGILIYDVNGTIPDFTSVSLNGATNWSGFSAAYVSFDADHIFVNFPGLPFDNSNVVSLDVNSASVPEPTTLALLSLGLAGLRLRRRPV